MRAQCPQCGRLELTYYSEYDTFGCEICDIFTEADHCKGLECDAGFKHAPAKPSLLPVTAEKEFTIDWWLDGTDTVDIDEP